MMTIILKGPLQLKPSSCHPRRLPPPPPPLPTMTTFPWVADALPNLKNVVDDEKIGVANMKINYDWMGHFPDGIA
jgi:hypothetical protein